MNKIWCCLSLIVLFITTASAQTISKNWQLNPTQKTPGQEQIFGNATDLNFNEGRFEFLDKNGGDTVASGDYLYQNKLLVLFYNTPKDTIQNLRVSALSDSTMTISFKGNKFALKSKSPRIDEVIPASTAKQMIPSQGISTSSLIRGVIGMMVLIIIAFLFSSNRKAINWKTVGLGITAQLILAIGVLKVTVVQNVFEFVGNIFVLILDFTAAGSEFLLGGMMDVDSFGFIFLFQVLPTIIFFSALTSVLFYLGVIQIVVKGMAWILTKLLGISGPESLSVAGNIFLGQTEAPLMIKAYLERMTRSEILLVMVGGMATVAGGVLAAYIGFLGGDDPALRLQFAKHLLAASVMAAPGAIVVSKILYPQQAPVNTDAEVSSEKIGSNILDAIANGTTEGLKLAANVAAMLLVFIAFIAMINFILAKIGGFT
ncbi:MAG: Na+ dependent nucleoside transporter, partial [Gramella sp.]|nr:Na+ dependent nucleoside transporter [Christiangramia sp.]